MWKGIVNKFVDVAGFQAHVDGLSFSGWRPSFVVVHNTSEPDLKTYADWRAHPEKHGDWTPTTWMGNLASYYKNLGWSGGPHVFVAPDGIYLFTPLTMPGTHSPAWNARTWGVETIGEFESEPFAGSPSAANLVAVLAILHSAIGLDPAAYRFGQSGIHFHKEDPVTTHKECPGKNMVKADLVQAVVSAIHGVHPGDKIEVPAAVHTTPNTPVAVTNKFSTSNQWLQAMLNRLGATPQLNLDGDYGPATKQAVLWFQGRTTGLVQDGDAGPLTRLAISHALAKVLEV